MFSTLSVSFLTTKGIKDYLTQKGYTVSVQNWSRFVTNSELAFAIKFTEYQKVPAEILLQLRGKSEHYWKRSSPRRLLLNDKLCIDILPLLPELKEGENSDIVNTQKADIVNTIAPEAKLHVGYSEAEKVVDPVKEIPKRRTDNQAIKGNQLALEILNASDFETKQLTPEERTILENYAGVGGQYEDDNQSHNVDALTQFYTPAFIGEQLYQIAYRLGFPMDGKVLEPSCGVGRLIKHAHNYSNVTAFEVSEIPYRISKKLYPDATIHNMYFEQAFLKAPRFNDIIRSSSPTWVEQYPFDLVIGNPPYGKHKNKWQSFLGYPKFAQIEFFFMYYAAKLLKPGGLLMYLTASNFIRTGGAYQANKEKVFEQLKIEGAYRMPNALMELTEIGTDILILRKK